GCSMTLPRISSQLLRRFPALSVRARIFTLAIIPVVGLAIIGLFFANGERNVAAAFDTLKSSSALANAAREFKSELATMRIAMKDYTHAADKTPDEAFLNAHMSAMTLLPVIESNVEERDQKTAASLRGSITTLTSNFEYLAEAKNKLGFGP